MTRRSASGLRVLAGPFVAEGPAGVAVRTRMRPTGVEDNVLREVGMFLGTLARKDLARRCRDGLQHDSESWAARKRGLTAVTSSRWAGAITKASHDQWGLSRRAQSAHLDSLDKGISTIRGRLSLPLGSKGSKGAPGGYRSRREWHAKSRRLAILQVRRDKVSADRAAGTVHVVAGGRRLANTRHNLDEAGLTLGQWRDRWDAARITFDPERSRWYLTAAWQPAPVPQVTLGQAIAGGCIGVDTNDDHYAAWLLDPDGNPIGGPKRFGYDMAGTCDHRDAQIRHATSRLLRWAASVGVKTIAFENLDFSDGKTREKHGRRKQFRRLISRFPNARLRARLVSMAAEQGITIVAVDPAYTSKWGAQHWQQPTSSKTRKTTRHEAASLVIGRRALAHPARRRTPPPRQHHRDAVGHRNVQARPEDRGRDGNRQSRTGPPTRSARPPGTRTRRPSSSKTVRDERTDHGLTPDQC